MNKIDPSKYNSDQDYNEYINSLLKELKNDEEVYNIIKEQKMTVGEVKANIAHLMAFKNDYNVCKNCPGLDKCPKAIKHFFITIRFDKNAGYLYRNNAACDKYMDKIKIDGMYADFDAPEEWKGKTIKDSVDVSSVRMPLFKEFKAITANNGNDWLYVTGNHKSGKSFLLATFATEFAKRRNKQVSFVNSARMVKELQDSIYDNKDFFANRMEQLESTPLLVLDGFGNELISEFTRENIMFPLLQYRSSRGLPTYFASDLTLDEIQSLYSVGKNNGAIRGKQLVNLIKDNSSKAYDITGIAYK